MPCARCRLKRSYSAPVPRNVAAFGSTMMVRYTRAPNHAAADSWWTAATVVSTQVKGMATSADVPTDEPWPPGADNRLRPQRYPAALGGRLRGDDHRLHVGAVRVHDLGRALLAVEMTKPN